MELRDYQKEFETNIYEAWYLGARVVCAVMPCGGGKTPIMANIIYNQPGMTFAIAHRQELVSQISLTLARWGVQHRIIAPDNIIRWIVQLHVIATGNNYYNPDAPCVVAGVDTLMRRHSQYSSLINQCKLWVIDEFHHCIKDNKWGNAVELFPKALGLGLTATPVRADGKGLGRHVDGFADAIVIGPTARQLINMGYLSDYRIFAPPSDLMLENVPISKSTGDYNPNKLKIATRDSHIVGDVVEHYLRIAPGMQGVTFATDIETAKEISANFRGAGVPAEILTGTTKAKIRVDTLRRFENREIKQIINVDIMGEGVDIPSMQVASFARKTESYGLYIQQSFRPMRPTPSMEKAIIIDHVGNVQRHGLPDAPRTWTLDRRERGTLGKRDPDVIPTRTCLNPTCMSVYEAIYSQCPFCGTKHIPAGRSRPEYVEGDLTELDPETLRMMRGEIEKSDARPEAYDGVIGNSILKNHAKQQDSQERLRDSIKWWAGHHETLGRPKPEIYKRFYFKFGQDMLAAQLLKRKDADALAININKDIDGMINKA